MWQAWHRVTKKMQGPVRWIVESGIAANRKLIKDRIPMDLLGSARKVQIFDEAQMNGTGKIA